MTQQEFMERTGITPTAEDFDYIHAVYLNTSMNKDEFCKDFKKHGDSRIIRDVHVRVLNYEMKCERQKEVIDNLTDFLIGKAQYPSFRHVRTIKLLCRQWMEIPLWKK